MFMSTSVVQLLYRSGTYDENLLESVINKLVEEVTEKIAEQYKITIIY